MKIRNFTADMRGSWLVGLMVIPPSAWDGRWHIRLGVGLYAWEAVL